LTQFGVQAPVSGVWTTKQEPGVPSPQSERFPQATSVHIVVLVVEVVVVVVVAGTH
jgi:hypothetical protein